MKKIKWIEKLFMQNRNFSYSQSWFSKIKTKEEAISAIRDLGFTMMFGGFAGALFSFLFVSVFPVGTFTPFFLGSLLTFILGPILIVSESELVAIIIFVLQFVNFILLFGVHLSSVGHQLNSNFHAVSLVMVYLSYRAIVGTHKLKKLNK